MVHHADWILLGIATALVSGRLAGALTRVSTEFGMLVGVVLATPFVYEALFRNPPLPANDVHRDTAAIVWHTVLVWLLLRAIS